MLWGLAVQRPKVLIAEDDTDLLDLMSAALEEGGAEITRALTGAELVEAILAGRHFDLLITDIAMPWISGLDVAREARNAGLNLAIIVITALQRPTVAREVKALAQRVLLLRKPFSIDALRAAVHRMLPEHTAAP